MLGRTLIADGSRYYLMKKKKKRRTHRTINVVMIIVVVVIVVRTKIDLYFSILLLKLKLK